jgi:hypothetical protein
MLMTKPARPTQMGPTMCQNCRNGESAFIQTRCHHVISLHTFSWYLSELQATHREKMQEHSHGGDDIRSVGT